MSYNKFDYRNNLYTENHKNKYPNCNILFHQNLPSYSFLRERFSYHFIQQFCVDILKRFTSISSKLYFSLPSSPFFFYLGLSAFPESFCGENRDRVLNDFTGS